MKISEFADKYNLSNDTVRYYMKLNLIIPEKKGGHYYFDEKCHEDIRELLKLKEMNFSLKEIKKIFNFKRIGKLTLYQKNKYYQSLYRNKIKELTNKMDELIEGKEKLEEEIDLLDQTNYESERPIGVSLNVLSLLSCPKCNNDLTLYADNVKDNQIIEGNLKCSCGKNYKIKDGILYIKDIDINNKIIEEDHIEKYIKNTDPAFMDKTYKSIEWFKRELFEDINDKSSRKVILEPGSGYGYFIRQIYSNLSDNTLYICVDNNPEVNLFLKNILEKTKKNADMLFITSDLPELPLKDNSVDILIDFTGTSCFSFENEMFLPKYLMNYLKDKALLLAVFIVYEKFGLNNYIKNKYRNNFKYNNIRQNILDLGFEIVNEQSSDTEKITKTFGKYEDFAQPGDKVYSYLLKAIKM